MWDYCKAIARICVVAEKQSSIMDLKGLVNQKEFDNFYIFNRDVEEGLFLENNNYGRSLAPS